MNHRTQQQGTNAPPQRGGTSHLRMSEVLSALSAALDLTEGQPEGHAVRSCWIGMRIAEELQLSDEQKYALFYALLLKDLGCSSNAAKMCWLYHADEIQVKRDIKKVDWTSKKAMAPFLVKRVASMQSTLKRAAKLLPNLVSGAEDGRKMIKVRCERGADITRMLGFPELTAQAILGLDERWNGQGNPLGLRGDEIPLLGRICGLAQTVEVFATGEGVESACAIARKRSGKWFDPALVQVVNSLEKDDAFWQQLQAEDINAKIIQYEPEDHAMPVDDESLDRVAKAFAQIVDAKSPWTYRHSEGVAAIAVGIAHELGHSPEELRDMERTGLLHDIGKLGVSNLILDKPGRLTDEEFKQMQQHTVFTQRILERVSVFQRLADVASAHHERLDGRGYHQGLVAEQLSTDARILAVADVCEALSACRPYREDLPKDKVMEIMQKEAGQRLCPEVFEALIAFDQKADCIGCNQESQEAVANSVAQMKES